MSKIDRLIDEELKPCPFCGKGNSIVELCCDELGYWQIGCGACGSHSGASKDKFQIIKLWNTRHS